MHAQAYCALQIGYFKAKHAFFRFTWDDAPDDCAFVLTRYFNDQAFEPHTITKHERYAQRTLIAKLFGYRLWSTDSLPQLVQQANQIVRRDITPGFIVAELIVYLNEHKIVRPGLTTLQELISEALSAERRRLGVLLDEVLDGEAKAALAQLLVRDDTLSELAALKQDAKSFGWRQMAQEREKRAKLEPLYRIAKTLLAGWRSRSRICTITRARPIFTLSTTFAASNPSRPTCICCATPGSVIDSLPIIS